MINIIVAYDELSVTEGANFENCYQRLKAEIDFAAFFTKILDGQRCTREEVEQAIIALEGNSFVFVGYSHGNSSALLSEAEQDGYVNHKNSYMFGCSIFYTNSCYSGDELRQALERADCHGFVGFEGEVLIPDSSEDENIFIDCENKGLVHFLTTGATLRDSVEVMKENYKTQYDIMKEDDFFKATRLLNNMELLVCYDKCNMTVHDLIVVAQ